PDAEASDADEGPLDHAGPRAPVPDRIRSMHRSHRSRRAAPLALRASQSPLGFGRETGGLPLRGKTRVLRLDGASLSHLGTAPIRFAPRGWTVRRTPVLLRARWEDVPPPGGIGPGVVRARCRERPPRACVSRLYPAWASHLRFPRRRDAAQAL